MEPLIKDKAEQSLYNKEKLSAMDKEARILDVIIIYCVAISNMRSLPQVKCKFASAFLPHIWRTFISSSKQYFAPLKCKEKCWRKPKSTRTLGHHQAQRKIFPFIVFQPQQTRTMQFCVSVQSAHEFSIHAMFVKTTIVSIRRHCSQLYFSKNLLVLAIWGQLHTLPPIAHYNAPWAPLCLHHWIYYLQKFSICFFKGERLVWKHLCYCGCCYIFWGSYQSAR